VLAKVLRYLDVGPEEYRKADALHEPREGLPDEVLAGIQAGMEQLGAGRGIVRSKPLEGLTVPDVHNLMGVLHFTFREVRTDQTPAGRLLDCMHFHHRVLPAQNVVVYAAYSSPGGFSDPWIDEASDLLTEIVLSNRPSQVRSEADPLVEPKPHRIGLARNAVDSLLEKFPALATRIPDDLPLFPGGYLRVDGACSHPAEVRRSWLEKPSGFNADTVPEGFVLVGARNAGMSETLLVMWRSGSRCFWFRAQYVCFMSDGERYDKVNAELQDSLATWDAGTPRVSVDVDAPSRLRR
jgi:hypothetical protein